MAFRSLVPQSIDCVVANNKEKRRVRCYERDDWPGHTYVWDGAINDEWNLRAPPHADGFGGKGREDEAGPRTFTKFAPKQASTSNVKRIQENDAPCDWIAKCLEIHPRPSPQ
ncbi:hypothetical protein CERZMDRAFT_92415 [Cercospora zeae-maydis SCOH1-5]|uniref:Uncharacterized protein n=1 Tax=Cercospora zeae-maydis SCOH1-5 TaxID=717836 RepID=A0A6A6FWF6_9PEZI|nr:hypothetical protein CERZMDRAFT_92415 [Cercospora zeae-maydis SCOH1-5]